MGSSWGLPRAPYTLPCAWYDRLLPETRSSIFLRCSSLPMFCCCYLLYYHLWLYEIKICQSSQIFISICFPKAFAYFSNIISIGTLPPLSKRVRFDGYIPIISESSCGVIFWLPFQYLFTFCFLDYIINVIPRQESLCFFYKSCGDASDFFVLRGAWHKQTPISQYHGPLLILFYLFYLFSF